MEKLNRKSTGLENRLPIKVVQFGEGNFLRAFVDYAFQRLNNEVDFNAGIAVVQTGDYPGWQPNPNSEILTLMHQLYVKRFNEEPQIKACHAGLECGILGKHLPGVDMISFGPNIRAAHSPDEKVQISSVQKFWGFFLEVLQQTPLK